MTKDTLPLSAIRPAAVEAIRAVTGCPDILGNGKSLVEELESIAALAAQAPQPEPQSPEPAQRAEWVGISLGERLDNLMHAAKWDADEVPHLKANLIRDIERCAQAPAVDAAPQQAQGVAAGFSVVPVEPTEGMLSAGYEAGLRDSDAWAAMLAAAPQAAPAPAGYALVKTDLIRRAQQAINYHLEPNSPDEHEKTMLELTAIGWPEHLEAPAPAPQALTDADRLDWLEQHDDRFYNYDKISCQLGRGFHVGWLGPTKQSLREAIDAARTASAGGEG